MPELPEVETIAAGLRRVLPGRTITGVVILGAHLCPSRESKTHLENLPGRRIQAIRRRGKLLLLELNDNGTLAVHLRMTGRIGLMPAGRAPEGHVHLLLDLDDRTTMFFQDQRKFGTCRFFGAQELEAWPFYARLGPEPLEISAEQFIARARPKKSRIKALLLDQQFLAGIGNIYADESLFRAGIHPAAAARTLSSARLRKLHAALRDVLTEAIAAGGSSIRDYRTAAGLVGAFQNTFQVYGRKDLPCIRCGRLMQSAKVAGRTSTFCPFCQQPPQHS